MKHTTHHFEKLHADTLSLRLWVMTLACVVTDWFERLLDRRWRIVLREVVRHLACDVRGLIVDIAVAGMAPQVYRKRTLRPGSTPPGFRRARRMPSAMRRFKRVVRLRGHTPGERLRWLRQVFVHLKTWLTRLHARLRTLKRVRAYILIAAPSPRQQACALVAPPCADTS